MNIPNKVKPIAFYLPQFHPIRLNDEWWGPGFTEWTNVTQAKPLFDGHFQPRLPGAMGFYDLRCAEVMEEQASLARSYGIEAFCFYYYRFNSQRVLERPVDMFLNHPEIDISFLYCWANEPWTRAWDGRSDDTLLDQDYGDVAFEGLVLDLCRAMADPRYMRIGGKPAFLIYQLEQVPDAAQFVERLRTRLHDELQEDVTIGCVFSHGLRPEMMEWVDFTTQFPPHRFPRDGRKRKLVDPETVNPYKPERADYFEAYSDISEAALGCARVFPRMFLGVTPDWDNSARRPREAHVVVGSTPELFQDWSQQAAQMTLEHAADGVVPDTVMFVNAWNEWAEGAMLEPSLEKGSAYLEAFQSGIQAAEAAFAAAQDVSNDQAV